MLLILALWALGGCRLARVERPRMRMPPAKPAVKPPQPKPVEEEKLREEIRKEIEREVRKEAEEKAAQELERMREEMLGTDLEVLGRMLDSAKAAVLERDLEKTRSALGGTRSALGFVLSETPLALVYQSALRARRSLEAGKAEEARTILSLVAKTAEKVKVDETPASEKLNSCLSAIEGGKAEEAKKALEELTKALSRAEFFSLVEKLSEHVDGAMAAAGRGAWKVAEAELEEAEEVLESLKAKVGPAKPTPEEEKKPAEERPSPPKGEEAPPAPSEEKVSPPKPSAP